jgi:hypothetical protein
MLVGIDDSRDSPDFPDIATDRLRFSDHAVGWFTTNPISPPSIAAE